MEKIRKFYKITPELQAFIDKVDWAPFRRFLLDEYGIDSALEVGLEDGQSIRPYIRCTKDLRSQCGIFGKAQKFVRLENFSSGIQREILSYDEKKYRKLIDEGNYSFDFEDVDAVFSPILLWAAMDLRYEHLNGGSNGTTLFTCQYTAKEGWSFKKAGN